jgi:hypothetical protein
MFSTLCDTVLAAYVMMSPFYEAQENTNGLVRMTYEALTNLSMLIEETRWDLL